MKHPSSSQGFTLIELMTAIALFSIFIIIMAGVFSRFVQVERHSIAQGSLILDLQSAVESFVKEARTGYGSTYRTENGKQVAFRNQAGICVVYRVNTSGVFERAENAGNTSGACDSSLFASSSYRPLTSKDTNITDVLFDTTLSQFDESTLALENQGVITLTFTANSLKGNIPPIRIQNTVTSRQVAAYEE